MKLETSIQSGGGKPVFSVRPMRFLTEKEVASELRMSPRTVRRMVASGTYPRPVKLGGKRLFSFADHEHYVAKLLQSH